MQLLGAGTTHFDRCLVFVSIVEMEIVILAGYAMQLCNIIEGSTSMFRFSFQSKRITMLSSQPSLGLERIKTMTISGEPNPMSVARVFAKGSAASR